MLNRRLITLFIALVALLLLVLLPPLLNVSRLQRRVARNISASLGRPVHFDQITLNLLPVPGFTLQNFVVDEDLAFGSEPILRASQVHANLRLRSLWGSHVEFSRISLTEPSVNLVLSADGQWNIGGLLLQASRTQAVAPYAQQPSAVYTPHLPYIEASGARLNFKLDQEKTPFSLTDADFALWLPQPHQWRLRLEAHPVRTDTSPADTGTVRVEASLGPAGASADSLANLPIDLHGSLQAAAVVGLAVCWPHATLACAESSPSARLPAWHPRPKQHRSPDSAQQRPPRRLRSPASLLGRRRLPCHCPDTFHAFTDIQCHWPPSDSSDPKLLVLTTNIPDVLQPNMASATLNLPSLPADTFFDWLGVATPHPPSGFTGPGTLAGNLVWAAEPQPRTSSTRSMRNTPAPIPQHSILTGELEFSHESLQLSALGPKAIPLGTLLLRSTLLAARSPHQRGPTPPAQSAGFDLTPISLPLGGKQPAVLDGRLDVSGYTLHLTGPVLLDRLLALGDAVPQLGDGLRQLLQPTTPARALYPTRKARHCSHPRRSHRNPRLGRPSNLEPDRPIPAPHASTFDTLAHSPKFMAGNRT